ncbi:NADP-dependent oxidoreductase domain-containing protein [Mycena crocata]|nr:NADP-dependent oxidoreductase domain-containing protein [Mycena crocata]
MTDSIQKQPLGTNGPRVPRMCFGPMGLSSGYSGVPTHEEGYLVLEHALNIGFTFWDTSDIYGDNEDLIGEWFKVSGRRSEVFLATKFGIDLKPDGSFSLNGKPEYVHASCEKSLKRLGVDCIDLYYAHRIDKNTPIEYTVKAMAELVKAGKVKYLGLSECSSSTLRRAHAIHPIAAVQIEYSPFSLDIEHAAGTDLLKTARELGVAIVAYSPLGRGLLTGAIKSPDEFEVTDVRRQMPRFYPENFNKNLELVEKLKIIADRRGVSTSELTLAWIIAQGPDFFPLYGTKQINYLDENIKALKLSLNAEEEAEIRKAVHGAEVRGDHYSAAVRDQGTLTRNIHNSCYRYCGYLRRHCASLYLLSK